VKRKGFEKCFQFDSILCLNYLRGMKTVQISIRDCPEHVHQAIRRSAQQNRRSLNKEALTWLEREARTEKAVTGAQWADRLRQARKLLTEKEHAQLAEDIQTARKLMNREHLR
jgi:hypothetical protein